MNDPVVRSAEESDAGILLVFMHEYYDFDGHHFDEEKSGAALIGLRRDQSLGRIWLVQNLDTPVGYIVLTLGYSLELLGRDAFIDEFYLREKYRGRGWGRKTMDFVEEEARSLGVNSLHLEVTRPNSVAKRFYGKLGFEDREHHLMTKRIAGSFSKSAAT